MRKKNIVIVDYGEGNINSIKRSFSTLGVSPIYSRNKDIIKEASALVMPGVGHFQTAMRFLIDNQLDIVLKQTVLEEKVPVLGICLGMQLMAKHSEEGNQKGLGWIDASVEKMEPGNRKLHKVPNIGWCLIKDDTSLELLRGIACETSPFYFSHSYAARKFSVRNVKTSTFQYEDEYVALFESENIFGVQFHPEKSHSAGVQLISNFLSKVRR